jgi:hypothetical protein
MGEKIKGDIIVESYDAKLKFETVAYQCGYSVAIEPQGGDSYRLRFYISDSTPQVSR